MPQWQNYLEIFRLPGVPYAQFYLNTAIITLSATAGAVITAAASAYGFARFRWWGRGRGTFSAGAGGGGRNSWFGPGDEERAER